MKKILLVFCVLVMAVTAFAQDKMIERVELDLKIKGKSYTYEMSQADYSFSRIVEDETTLKSQPLTGIIWGNISSSLDDHLLDWIINGEGDISGSVKIYYKGANKPGCTLEFERSVVTSYSESFSPSPNYYTPPTVYISASIAKVTLNHMKVN